jgi:2-hydroxy-6-oxonona-2,4-dienedioate hydrolase
MNANEASELIENIENKAYRIETSCGSGKMIWRRWGEGRPVVLLHGGAGSWMHWIKNIESLAKTHAVWVPDMPGFGDSDLPSEDDLDADTLAPFVVQGANEILHGARFDLVGFSFGSLVAVAIAIDPPSTLDKVVLVSASGLGLFQGSPTMKSFRGVTDPHEKVEVIRFNLKAMMLHDSAGIDDLAIAIQQKSARRDRVKNRKLARTDFVVQNANRWRGPVYGIWGREDYAYRDQFSTLTDVVAQLNLREAIFIEGGGHWLPFERSDEFNDVLARVLNAPETNNK